MDFLNERMFYVFSLAIILLSFLPFVISFEGRRPKARELVIISILCAMTVIGRLAFFMLPQFTPTLALIIISGAALGKGSGFLVGAVSAFVSNIFFGQGPWTPWQMFAMGLVGFFAGLLFHRRINSEKSGRTTRVQTLLLAVYGGFAAIVIFGGIMNPASVLMFQPSPTVEMFILSFVLGFPFDAVQAAATAVFLLIGSRAMFEKILRAVNFS